MAQPSTRQELIDYCKRKLGAPVLEINVADEQIEDLVDDAVQFFQERHFDGVAQTYLKYQITQDDIDRGRSPGGSSPTVGIATTSATTNIVGTAVTFNYQETSNYLQVPPSVIGIQKYFILMAQTLLPITCSVSSINYFLMTSTIGDLRSY